MNGNKATQAGTAVLEQQNIAAMWRDIQRNASSSKIKLRKTNGPVSTYTLNMIRRNDLTFHPYRVHT